MDPAKYLVENPLWVDSAEYSARIASERPIDIRYPARTARFAPPGVLGLQLDLCFMLVSLCFE